MTDWTFAGRTYQLDVLDVLYDFAHETDTAFDWWFALGFGESGLNANERTGDAGTSFGVFQIHIPVHGGPPEKWLGVEGTRTAMRHMWGNRWAHQWQRMGGWGTWAGTQMLPSEAALGPVGDATAPDPRSEPRRGRAAYVYHAWPRYQGSIRPTWDRALQVEAEASLLAVAYAEGRGPRFAPQGRERELLDAITYQANDMTVRGEALMEHGAALHAQAQHLYGIVSRFGQE